MYMLLLGSTQVPHMTLSPHMSHEWWFSQVPLHRASATNLGERLGEGNVQDRAGRGGWRMTGSADTAKGVLYCLLSKRSGFGGVCVSYFI